MASRERKTRIYMYAGAAEDGPTSKQARFDSSRTDSTPFTAARVEPTVRSRSPPHLLCCAPSLSSQENPKLWHKM